MTDDQSDAFKKAMRAVTNIVDEKLAEKLAEKQARIIADGVASASRRSIPKLSQRDRKFLKSIRIVAW